MISSTGARGYQIQPPLIEAARAAQGQRPLLLIDLAVPRDIDPAVAALPGVILADIDDLQPQGEGQDGRRSAVERVEVLLSVEAERFMLWWQSRRAVPTIAALRDQAESIRRAELDKTLGRMPNLSPEERGRIEALTAAIVNKLLHQPITRLKDWETDGRYLETVRELFSLQAGGAD